MWGHQWGFMDGWGGFGWYGPVHMLIWIAAIILVVALIVWAVRSGTGPGAHAGRVERRSPGLDVLEERYARGEISRDEFLQKKRDMTG